MSVILPRSHRYRLIDLLSESLLSGTWWSRVRGGEAPPSAPSTSFLLGPFTLGSHSRTLNEAPPPSTDGAAGGEIKDQNEAGLLRLPLDVF